jgi:hypothetical protein
LLRDPYLIVHRTAVQALNPNSIPSELHRLAFDLVGAVLVSNLREHVNGEFISDCINQYLDLAEQIGIETLDLVQGVVGLLDRIPAPEAAEMVYSNWRIRKALNFSDLLVRLLHDDTLPEYYVESLDDALETLADVEIQRHSVALRDISLRRVERSPNDVLDFIHLLGRCGAWEEARLVARALVDQTQDTRAEKPRRLRYRALECAVEIEAAAVRQDHGAIASAASNWKAIVQGIQQDDEENAEARRPFSGLRIPDKND